MSFKAFNTVVFSKNWLSAALCTAAEASRWHPTDLGFQIFICHFLAEWAIAVSLKVGFVRAAVRAGAGPAQEGSRDAATIILLA